MTSSLQGRSIRLELISGKNLEVPSGRIPAGIYVSIKLGETRRWRSAIRILSSNQSVMWSDTVTLSSHTSFELSFEIRASFELGRMLGHGEFIRKLETSWNELLDHGDGPFDLLFPPFDDICPSLTIKVAFAHTCEHDDSALLDDWVVAQCLVGHPDRAAALTNLARARLEGYIQEDRQDIDCTISLFREALALRPQGHPDHPLSLYLLTEALTWRHNNQDTTADICESAQIYHELLPLCPEDTNIRNIVAGEDDASDEGIHLRRTVLELCPLGHEDLPTALHELARAVEARFQQCGTIDDLDESIQIGREVVRLCPKGHPRCDTYLNDLAVSLGFRFRYQGNPHDLGEAIPLYEDALRLCPVEHEFRGALLGNLGNVLRTRFNQHDDIHDLDRAISLHREALTLCPPGNPDRNTMLHNLALALDTRYDELLVGDDLNEAINMYRESLRVKQTDYSERHLTLSNLSSVLCSRFMQTQKNEDVEEAIGLCKEALAALPSLHPDRYFSYHRLQEAYLSRYRILHNPDDLSLVVENFRLASRHPTQGFPERILTALDWVEQAEDYEHESALEAYQLCLDLFDNHVMTRSSIISRREAAAAFRPARTLPVDATSWPWPTVVTGLSTQRLHMKTSSSAYPILAHKFAQLSQRLSDVQGSAAITDRAAADLAAREYRRLTEQWEATVAEIRDIQGFSRFLLPPLYTDLQEAARHGPVIILVASQYSCNALIVPTSGEPRHVPITSLTLADVETLKCDFAREIRHASFMGPKESRTNLIVLLRKIWDEVMLPIVKVLHHDLKVKPRSRIWLCPTAAFTSIPLHAAHPSRMKADNSGRELCLEDIYICSYTPTPSALIRSRQTNEDACDPVVSRRSDKVQPGAGQGTMLAAVDSELELVRKLVHPHVNFTRLSGDEATQAGALEALRRNTWVHLACHGKQDHKPLTLLDIMENDAPHAEFAFLSACHTAVGDEETPDEVIHLAAGLQFSGFKSVIGTLWVVDDAFAKHVVEAFYERLFKDLEEGDMPDCTKAALALNHATYAVKNKVPLEQRIVFIHIAVFFMIPHIVSLWRIDSRICFSKVSFQRTTKFLCSGPAHKNQMSKRTRTKDQGTPQTKKNKNKRPSSLTNTNTKKYGVEASKRESRGNHTKGLGEKQREPQTKLKPNKPNQPDPTPLPQKGDREGKNPPRQPPTANLTNS
ncbi:CHAT domain-containing protein [Suillus lakei]|nr:CHAT domain-containing protein [Suillus lakei]